MCWPDSTGSCTARGTSYGCWIRGDGLSCAGVAFAAPSGPRLVVARCYAVQQDLGAGECHSGARGSAADPLGRSMKLGSSLGMTLCIALTGTASFAIGCFVGLLLFM